ncbi:hypothetical protein C8R43DRAFT_1140052 [Mycena crocata]|nr:hypothetical protein C8R43DRAFT_1140052 [Mycena crocata]
MTECGALTGFTHEESLPASHRESGVVTYSVGNLLPGVVVRVVKSNGSISQRGQRGKLWVQTASVLWDMQHIVARDEETFGSDGWLRTGDVYFDENDELFVVQHLKEFMKVKGFRVNPADIEARLLQHLDVVGCCVVCMGVIL